LDRILQFVTQQVNFAYDVGGDAVTIQPSDSIGGNATSVTEFFPISRATVIRLTGFRDSGGSSSGPVDPFAPSGGGSSGPSQNDEVEALQNFFQSAGVNFEISGASLAFDGEQLIVTQSRRNLERMRTILRNYNEVKQVEIEAKFLEVAQGDLEELGFNYTFNRYANQTTSVTAPISSQPVRFVNSSAGTAAGAAYDQNAFGVDLSAENSVTTNALGGSTFSSILQGSAWRGSDGNLYSSPIVGAVGGPVAAAAGAVQTTITGLATTGFDNEGQTTTLTQRVLKDTSTMGGRGLSGAFGGTAATANAVISTPGASATVTDQLGNQVAVDQDGQTDSIPFSAPTLPGVLDLAQNAAQFFTYGGLGISDGLDVDIAIQALMRKTSSDLMSAPKITVLSGKRASIVVAQELRYPESYGDIESTVSSSNSGGSAISITAGTPQDFVTRNVGVEMSVTPNVENDDTISLILEPRVTEFEGFVEYGGPSIALAGGTSALVPAGFYQPIFSTREVSTEVTVFDGATIVMGGLTREDVKTVSDKVPLLGDMPGIGRLFRSEGETRMKRNLLIFITANLVSPGGSPARQNYRNVNANSLFQNPTIMTPSGSANRSIESNP
jgi:type II secretory pathway component GspD/PulD (secretin)